MCSPSTHQDSPTAHDCISCGEGNPKNECPKSKRPCGHHCNCSWMHDHCHWCDKEFGEETQDSPKVPGRAISADALITVLEQALDAEAQLPTPESAGFETGAIRDFLTFVQAHGGFEVPTGRVGTEPVHFGSLMSGLTIGAVAARQALLSDHRSLVEGLVEALVKHGKHGANCATVYDADYDCSCGFDAAFTKAQSSLKRDTGA